MAGEPTRPYPTPPKGVQKGAAGIAPKKIPMTMAKCIVAAYRAWDEARAEIGVMEDGRWLLPEATVDAIEKIAVSLYIAGARE